MFFLARVSFFLVASLALAKTPVPADWSQSPIAVVSENVNLSIGEKMTLVVGRYWYQYVPRLDDHGSTRVAIHYATIVPSDIVDYKGLVEISQAKLMLGEKEFLPESARLLSDAETGPVPTLPHGSAIAWFTFQIPRSQAELRFDVVISHFQAHYRYEGKAVAAYWPWLPNLEELRRELELLQKNFVVTVEALPGVSLEKLTTNNAIDQDTPRRWVVHPRHQELIAVAVAAKAKE